MKRLVAFSIVAALCGMQLAAQQQAPPSTKVERKNLAPVSKDVLQVKLPKPVETTLSNGLTVLILEDHRLPLVSLQYSISAAGAVYEPPETPGVASITAQMLREGTTTRKSLQIAQEIELLGSSIGASSGFGSSAASVNASGLSDNFDRWFALAHDLLLNPVFPQEELDRLKQRLKVSLRQQRASPAFLNNERFSKAVYGSHPGSVVTMTEASIDAITPEVLAKWHRERWAPQNAILGIAGDVKPAELIPKLEQTLAAWKKSELMEVLPANPTPPAQKKIWLVNRPNSVQTSIAMGNLAIDRRHTDYIPLTVANHVIGGGPTGRLFINLREEKGYTYGAGSGFAALKWPGPWRASAEVRTEVTEGAMTEFFNEINRLRDQLVTERDLDEAKRAIVASFALSLENPDQLLNYQIIRKIYGFPADYWDTYPARVMAITPADVQRVARKYIDPANIQIVAVGDVTKIRSIMEKFGPVEVYEADGRKAGN